MHALWPKSCYYPHVGRLNLMQICTHIRSHPLQAGFNRVPVEISASWLLSPVFVKHPFTISLTVGWFPLAEKRLFTIPLALYWLLSSAFKTPVYNPSGQRWFQVIYNAHRPQNSCRHTHRRVSTGCEVHIVILSIYPLGKGRLLSPRRMVKPGAKCLFKIPPPGGRFQLGACIHTYWSVLSPFFAKRQKRV